MTHFALEGGMQDITIASIKHALFESGEFEVEVSKQYNDIGLDWSDESNLEKSRQFEPNEGLYWDGEANAEGILWGAFVESLIVQSTTSKYLPEDSNPSGTILYIETAEDILEPWMSEYLLTGFGERGWFSRFQAVLVGRSKAWEFDKQKSTEEKAAYMQQQRETVLKIVREYNKTIPVIQNLDFGHTNPQILLPSGNKARISSSEQKLFLSY